MDYSLIGPSVHGDSLGKNTGVGCHAFLQGGSSQPRDRTQVSPIAGRFFTVCVIREATRKFRVVVFKLQQIRWGFLSRTQTGKIWGWFLPWTLNLRGTEHSSCSGMSSMKFSEPFQCLGPARASGVILEGCPSLDNTVRFQVQHSSLWSSQRPLPKEPWDSCQHVVLGPHDWILVPENSLVL